MSTHHPERPDDAFTPDRYADDRRDHQRPHRAYDDDVYDDDDTDDEQPEPRRSFGASVLAAVRELVIVIVLAMVLSFIVKTWLFQAFYIPSGSMESTLVQDDRVIVSKLTPGPFDLRRGDVVVFEDPMEPTPWLNDAPIVSDVGGPLHDLLVFVGLLPEDSENHLIKRVIGLPGDHVQADGKDGKLKVNGVEITEPYIKAGDLPSEGKPFDIVVPEGHIWVMGDHRSDSSDSRYHDPSGNGTDGSVPLDKLVGRALFIVWPIDHVNWLGVPARTFEKVPEPSGTPTPRSTEGTPATTTTKAAAG
ncbi:MAG TPA: signal peptidase I [Dermatophilaceae bacterium]|nr:signal peptidase I [Dermatophilaceae bacterium]